MWPALLTAAFFLLVLGHLLYRIANPPLPPPPKPRVQPEEPDDDSTVPLPAGSSPASSNPKKTESE